MTIEEITKGSATSPADLIDLQEELATDACTTGARWAFRGQSKAFGTLAPSFQRIFTRKKSVGTAEIIEQDLIKAFRSHYETLPDRTQKMPEPSEISSGLELRCLSVMQHYGVPTRLLDWSADLWTSVYFACAGDPGEDAELWMYNRRLFEWQNDRGELAPLRMPLPPHSIPAPEPNLLLDRGQLILELDPQLTPRMREQRAHHTVTTDVFADHAPLIAALTENSPLGGPNAFRRIIVSNGCKERALKFLAENKKVTASTIFPDVEGLGRFLRWHLESLVTTLM